jgi:hypothetical protein
MCNERSFGKMVVSFVSTSIAQLWIDLEKGQGSVGLSGQMAPFETETTSAVM